MPQITIALTQLQYDGVIAAQEFNNPELTPEQYVEKVMVFAAESYMKQFGVERPTVESLSLQLGATQDALAVANSEKSNLASQLESKQAELDAALLAVAERT